MAEKIVQFSLQNVVTASLAQRDLLVKLRVVVADDNPEFLFEMIRTVLALFDIIATASDGRSALDSIRTLEPRLPLSISQCLRLTVLN
jgi:hypothetical protein